MLLPQVETKESVSLIPLASGQIMEMQEFLFFGEILSFHFQNLDGVLVYYCWEFSDRLACNSALLPKNLQKCNLLNTLLTLSLSYPTSSFSLRSLSSMG